MLSSAVALLVAQPLLFQPSVSGEVVAFVHDGDVFVASKRSGWEAIQLTRTAGSESSPKLSPDARQVAFLDPGGAVHCVSTTGANDRRLTFGPRALTVLGWKNSIEIAYASEEASSLPESFGLSFVNAEGGQPSHTGVQEIGFASFSRESARMIFSRSVPSTGSQALFQGGDANQLVFMDLVNGKVTMPYPSRYSRMFAHQVKNDIYFVGTEGQSCLNLWRIRGSKVSRVTDFIRDGVRWLAGDGRNLVFEQGGLLYSFDTNSDRVDQIPIRLKSEAAPVQVSRKISEWISEVTCSPQGDIAFVSRGKAFAMIDQTPRRLTDLAESEESQIVFTKDGKTAAFVVETPDGRWLYQWDSPKNQLSRRTPLLRDPSWIGWSADGETLFYALDRQAIFAVDRMGNVTEVGRLSRWTTSYSVSHDGRFVAVTNAINAKRTQLVVFDRVSKSVYYPSDTRYEDLACAFDQGRPVLYLISRRQGRPTLGDDFPNLNLLGGTVLIEFSVDEKSLSRPKSGRWIDLGDLSPTACSGTSDGVWLHDENGDYRWNPDTRTAPKAPVSGTLDPWGVAAHKQEGSIISVESYEKQAGWSEGRSASISGDFLVNPHSEWKSIYWAAHRFNAEQFHDPNMGGVDWKAVGKHYESYLARINTRRELQPILSRMIGELVGGHNGVSSSAEEPTTPPQARAPYSGMVVGWDGVGNRILYVYRGRDDLSLFGSVSNPVEGKVAAGEYILAVNGISLTPNLGFDQVTAELGKTELMLKVAQSKAGPARDVSVSLPGTYLRYSDFLIRSEETVDRLSNHRIAYAHIFDTASQGVGSFVDGFFGQTHKSGFLLDARWNRGGFSNPGIINSILEKSLFREVKRYGDSTPDRPGVEGPVALLINREAVSGGDLLAHAFRSQKVGPIVGTTTSGRTIGNQWYRRLADGTTVRTSEALNLDSETGRSTGENLGTRPDFEIEIAPRLDFSIVDDQLIEAVRQMIKRLPRMGKAADNSRESTPKQ